MFLPFKFGEESFLRISYIYMPASHPLPSYQPSFYPLNPLTPNGHYSGRTAPLTSRRCILNIYSTNIRTEYIKHAK
jgi:hypothetical protein